MNSNSCCENGHASILPQSLAYYDYMFCLIFMIISIPVVEATQGYNDRWMVFLQAVKGF